MVHGVNKVYTHHEPGSMGAQRLVSGVDILVPVASEARAIAYVTCYTTPEALDTTPYPCF